MPIPVVFFLGLLPLMMLILLTLLVAAALHELLRPAAPRMPTIDQE